MASQVVEIKIQETAKSWADHAKLSIDLLGPLVATVFGIWVLKLTKRIEQNQWRNQKLIEKRILVWDQLGPLVNDIYCYCKRIGSWKEMDPRDVIYKKRAADKVVHITRPYFSCRFLQAYRDFTDGSFATFQEHGADARIRTSLWEHRNARQDWDASWDSLLSDTLNEDALDEAYEEMLHQVRGELESGHSTS